MMQSLILIFSFSWRSMAFTEVWANPFCSLNPHIHSVPGWSHRVFSFIDIWKVAIFFFFSLGISRSGLFNKTKGKGEKKKKESKHSDSNCFCTQFRLTLLFLFCHCLFISICFNIPRFQLFLHSIPFYLGTFSSGAVPVMIIFHIMIILMSYY